MRLTILVFVLMAMFMLPKGVLAAPKNADDARQLVVEWLKRDPTPLGAALGGQVKEVQTFRDDKGEPVYHVLYLDPSGFIIVPADDLVEPIIAFASQGRFDPATDNPLGAFISSDVPARVAHARALRAPPGEYLLKARNKWQALLQGFNGDTNSAPVPPTLATVSDLRIAPFVQTLWNQGTANNGMACFNYYTPPYAAGSPSNWPCGCVATCLAQLLGYFQYPKAGVGTNSFPISVDGTNETARLRGGDGAGGPYAWNNMPANPVNPTVAQCQAIGALMYDCGVSENMGYGPGGSGAGSAAPGYALVQTFMYSNAIIGATANASVFDPSLVTMVNANLDARLPVGVALNGHNVVCDGYGYDSSTLYNHINMGWGGEDNAWYTLPMVDGFTNIWYFMYNIYTNRSGEIISGRVMSGNVPLPNATVTALRSGGGTYTATTDTNGIYALAAIPSASQYTITASLTNFIAELTNCSTGTSVTWATNSGNVWGQNFSLVRGVAPPLITAQPQDQSFVDLGGTATFSVSALGKAPISYQWQFNGTNLPGATNSSLTITNVHSPNTGSYRVVVTDSYGSVTSAPAALSIASPPILNPPPTSQPGFIARCSQIYYAGADAAAVMNSIPNMEAALGPVTTNQSDGGGFLSAGVFSDPLTGLYCSNVANLSAADANGFFFIPGYINMDISGPTAQDGDFTSPDGVTGWPKSPFPGIPGQIYPGTTEFAVAYTAYVSLPAGVTEFGVDSDDGFLLTISSGANPNEAFSRAPAGEFNGVRGWSDTLMDVTVPTNGSYALRLDYEQGTGGASCELFTVVDGVKILVNDTNNPSCLLAYPTPEVYAEPYAALVSPAPGQTNVAFGSPVAVLLQDGVPTTVNTNSIVLKLNGAVVAPAISQTPSFLPNGNPIGNLTTITYAWTSRPPLAAGNTAELIFADSKGNLTDRAWTFTNEPILSALDATRTPNFSATNSGFLVYPWHTSAGEPNDVAVWTEEQILGWMGPNYATAANWPNSQNGQTENALFGPQGWCLVYTNYINWDIEGPTDGWGDFTSPDGVTGWPKQEFPGLITGNYADESGFPTTDGNNFSMLVETWLDFPAAGTWQMGVYSDDGFSVKSGQAPGDVFGQLLGEFEGGRSGESLFPFFVPQPGMYPFRLLYEQGGGGANCEWFTVTSGGQRVLINDSSQGTNAIYSYVTAESRPIYVSGVSPVIGATGVGPDSDITAFVVDGYPAQVASVQMWINGTPAIVTATRSNNVTAATAFNTGSPLLLLAGTTNTVTIVYTDNAGPCHSYTNSWQFAVAAASVPGGYVTLNPLNANASVNVSPANSGFLVYPWHTSAGQPNDVAVWTEEQILGLMGTNYATVANWPDSQNGETENAVSGPQGNYFVYTNYINWDLYGPTDGWGQFTSPDGVTGYPKQEFPGIICGSYPGESGFPTTDPNN
ncbi:MAG: C10 family peptidase, partial [Verrucomicrobiota bacterium]